MHGTLPVSDEQALALMRERPAARVDITALSRDWGWPRDKVRRRLKRWRRTGELPPAPKRRTKARAAAAPAAPAAAAAVEPGTPSAAHARAHRLGPGVGVACLALVGVALAGIGMVETTAYALSVGGLLFAALAVCADALVLVMPAALIALWRRRSPAALLAVALWLVGCIVTLANLSGYVGGSDDRFRAGRETQSVQRALALEQLTRLRHERATIAETRPAAALRLAIRNARRVNRAPLREALAVAERRDAVETDLSALGAGLSSLPSLAAVDPSAQVLSELTGTTVTEADLRRVRLALLLLLPLCGGFVLSVAASLLPLRPCAPNGTR